MPTEPLEKAPISRSIASSLIVMIAPLPNCFSIVETASSIALRFWSRGALGAGLKGRTFFAMDFSPSEWLGRGPVAAERHALEGGVQRRPRAGARSGRARPRATRKGAGSSGAGGGAGGVRAVAHAPEGQVRPERARLGREAGADHRGLDGAARARRAAPRARPSRR